MAQFETGDYAARSYIEPSFTAATLIFHTMLSGETATVGALKDQMEKLGMPNDVYLDTLSMMQSTGRVVVDEYTGEVEFYRSAPFN